MTCRRSLSKNARRGLALAAALAVTGYLVLLFAQAWSLQMGGITYRTSPFAALVPSECRDISRIGSIQGSTGWDAALLRGRISRERFEALVANDALEARCLGYQVLIGAHYPEASGVNFKRVWTDGEGQPIVSIEVKYHKPIDSDFFKSSHKQGESK